MIRRLMPAALVLGLFSLSACGQSALIGAAPQGATYTAAGAKAPRTKDEFLKAVAAKGVKLSEAQLAIIAKERNVVPAGTFAPRPAAGLSADQNWVVHFNKHGHEFNPAFKTKEAYLAGGVATGKGEAGEIKYLFDTTSFKKDYQTHVIRWNPKTLGFTAFRGEDGAMTTFYRNKPNAGRFIEVPAL